MTTPDGKSQKKKKYSTKIAIQAMMATDKEALGI